MSSTIQLRHGDNRPLVVTMSAPTGQPDPDGDTLDEIWCTIKEDPAGEADNQAFLQQTKTSGGITVDGTDKKIVYVAIPSAKAAAMVPGRKYSVDVQAKLSGVIDTMFHGTLVAPWQQVTLAT